MASSSSSNVLHQRQGRKSKAQGEVRLMGGPKRIAKLKLEENKSDLLKDSVFRDLSKITSPKESSSLLLTPLYRSYDAHKGVFVFNDEASFSFCSKEIAEVTGMRDSGISLKEYEEGLSSFPHFPQYLFKLRGELVSGAKGKISANHIRAMLMGMSVGDDEGKLIFKKLMIFYLMEEVLLCEANSSRVPRAKMWQLVEDIEKCETGPMPVLEAIIYNRIREIQPKLSDKKSQESPPIQKYKGQRVKDLDIVLKALKASDVNLLNSAAGGNFLDKMPRECLKIIESKSKVRQSRAKAVVAKVSTNSSTLAVSSEVSELKDMVRALLLDKKNQSSAPASSSTPAPVKAIEPNCVTCGGAHSYQNCPATSGNVYRDNIQDYFKANDAVLRNMQSQGQGSGTLPSNAIFNPKEDLKGITTRSGAAYQGPTIPTQSKVVKQGTEMTKDQVQTPSSQSTTPVQPPVTQSETQTPVLEPVVAPVSVLILYPSRRDNERRSLIGNKGKLSEMARTSMNEHCSTVILNKLPRKLGDPSKFLIPCEFPGMDECLALADLGTSINPMPLFMWEGVLLSELTPTCMTLKLADRSVSKPIGIAKDVSVKVRVFHFPADFVVVDFEPDPPSPLSSREINPFYYDPERDILLLEAILNSKSLPPLPNHEQYMPSYKKELKVCEAKTVKSSVDEPPEVELKDLPPHLEYVFLEGDNKLPVIIAKELGDEEKSALIKVLKFHKRAIAWKLSDIQEVEKLLDAGLIYPISDSPWVSPVHCVPKKGDFTVVENEENKLIPTQLVTRWRACIDYRKLNEATRKDHFPLPFMDQMLGRDWWGTNTIVSSMVSLGILKFPLTLMIRRKQRSPVPTGRLPIDACLSTMEVFMDDFSVFGNSFGNCLSRLDKMLQRCEDTNLSLNWEKSHFRVKEGIVLRHKISKNGIEVDRAKVDVIAKLPHPTTVKGIRSFLSHAGFYRRFIQDFSKISRPMTHLLEKNTPFIFSEDCIKSFQTLKKRLTEAPILIAPNWDLPFELMCDASDFAIVAVLGKRHERHFKPIHYASKTMNDAESNYTTTEKEMLAVVYAFEKFRSYLIMNKSIVHTDHSALKYLFAKKDAKARLLR
uniref:Reverse transcriptase domain-containing protein n=1 Tax=Tanacetum cinerariifolium TaxID=118510 RepID=A0A6L2JK18_TANCI|nr:reverse transcriptase domain-containing protein [Tanacetum cinerariifolium]